MLIALRSIFSLWAIPILFVFESSTFTQNFLDKNHDVIRQDIVNLLRTSSNALVRDMLVSIRVADDSDGGGGGGGGGGGASRRASSAPGKAAKTQTLGAEFRKQLEELMLNISTTSPHYVRCIKVTLN